MLPGTMYPRKTYGRSLFIGEFKLNSANIANAEIGEVKATVTEKSLDQAEADSAAGGFLPPSGDNGESIRVDQKTPSREENNEKAEKEEDLKLFLKKPNNPTVATKTKKSLTSKAFFTPAEIVGKDGDTEPHVKVVDLPVLKEESENEANKSIKKLKPQFLSSQQITGGKKATASKSQKLSPRTKSLPKITSPSAKVLPTIKEHNKTDDNNLPPITVGEQIRSTDSEIEPIQNKEDVSRLVTPDQQLKQPEEEPKEESVLPPVAPVLLTDLPPLPVEEAVKEEERDSEENKSLVQEETSSVASKSPRNIVIKPSELAAYSEKLIVDERNPESVLEPDVVADIKRGLAEKGIIVLPPSLTPVPQILFEEEDGDIGSKDTLSELEQNLEATSDKFDKRESFKTNKSFEIRRLQARAERRKEEKRRALFGSRYHHFKSKGDQVTNKALKSVLKPATPPTGEDDDVGSSPVGKLKSMVRIRDPEFDYQEYTDVELESDEMDSICPNSALSYSDLTADTDSSSDLSTLSTTTAGASDPELSSDELSEDSNLHRLYDEIDNLSPSRQGYYNEETKRENFSRDSKRSGTSMVTKRSSLHLTPDPNYTQNPLYINTRPPNAFIRFDETGKTKS